MKEDEQEPVWLAEPNGIGVGGGGWGQRGRNRERGREEQRGTSTQSWITSSFLYIYHDRSFHSVVYRSKSHIDFGTAVQKNTRVYNQMGYIKEQSL